MAVAFNTTVRALEDELMTLILDGHIAARIDSHNKILLAKDTDQRCSTYEKVEFGMRSMVSKTKY
jgi:COP9 signalosome complex subunit 1